MTVRKIISALFLPKQQVLGRWRTNGTYEQQHVQFILANTDHCGDKICGDPVKTKGFLKTNISISSKTRYN